MYIKRKETNTNKTLKQVINSLHNWIQNVMIGQNMQVKIKQKLKGAQLNQAVWHFKLK